MKIWIGLLIIYAGFFLWYTDIGGRLDKEEIQLFLEKLEEMRVQRPGAYGALPDKENGRNKNKRGNLDVGS